MFRRDDDDDRGGRLGVGAIAGRPAQRRPTCRARRLEPQAPPRHHTSASATPAPPQPPARCERGAAAARPRPAQAPPAPPAPRREGLPINVRVEVTITDKKPNVAPVTKTVTVVAGDGMRGSIRSEGFTQGRPTPLNVDVDSNILADNKVRVALNLQYRLRRRR